MRIFSRASSWRRPLTMTLPGVILVAVIVFGASELPRPTQPASTGPHAPPARTHFAAPIAPPVREVSAAARQQLLRAIVFGGGPARPFGFFR